MTKNTPIGAKKHHEGTELETHQTAKMFFFLLFHTKQQHFSLSSALGHCFSPGLKSREAIRTAH